MSDQDYQVNPKLQEERKQRREELRKKRQQRKMIIYAALAVILVLVIVLAVKGCTKDNSEQPENLNEPPVSDNEPVIPPEEESKPAVPDAYATLAAVGDIMCYDEQIQDAKTEDGGYDFTHCFASVKQTLSAADLTVGNLETNFAGTPYSGYPYFSTPPAMAEALKDAGFDLLQTANTYSMENGITGLRSTITALNDVGIDAVGTYASKEAADENGGVVIREVNGIKFAFIAYTKGINGRTRPADNSYCVNVLYTDYTTNYSIADETTLLSSVKKAKELEADVIVAMLHWGGEYDIEPNESQNQIAELLFKNGVDVVLGSHAHVVGPMEERTITTLEGETKQVFIAYNLGNFLSSMTKDKTQASAILNLSFFKSGETGKTTISKVEYVPVFIADHGEDAENRYAVLDIETEMDRYIGGAENRVSAAVYGGIKNALDTLHNNAGDKFATK